MTFAVFLEEPPPGLNAAPLRQPDPEEELGDLDHGRHDDRRQAPHGRQDEDGKQDGAEEKH